MTHYFARLWAALCGKPYWGDSEEDDSNWDCDEFEEFGEYEPEWERKPFNQRIAGLNELISIADYKGPSVIHQGDPHWHGNRWVKNRIHVIGDSWHGEPSEPTDGPNYIERLAKQWNAALEAMKRDEPEKYAQMMREAAADYFAYYWGARRPHNDDAHDDTWPHAAPHKQE